jgi:hypothetical protein
MSSKQLYEHSTIYYEKNRRTDELICQQFHIKPKMSEHSTTTITPTTTTTTSITTNTTTTAAAATTPVAAAENTTAILYFQ